MGLDEVVHAARVGRQRGAVLRPQRAIRRLRNAPHAQPARIAVEFQSPRTRDFREVPAGQAPQRIHLEEPVLRRRVALREKGVILARRGDVRHSQRIARDGHTLRNRRRDDARSLG